MICQEFLGNDNGQVKYLDVISHQQQPDESQPSVH